MSASDATQARKHLARATRHWRYDLEEVRVWVEDGDELRP